MLFGLDAFPHYQESNRRTTTGGCPNWDSFKSTTLATQPLIEQLKAVVFEKKELEYLSFSTLKALLLLLAQQNSNSDVDFRSFQNE